jgi:hypothetical protein
MADKTVTLSVHYDDIPDNAIVTGKAINNDTGVDGRSEKNASETVHTFRREKFGEVRKVLEGKKFDQLVFDDFHF